MSQHDEPSTWGEPPLGRVALAPGETLADYAFRVTAERDEARRTLSEGALRTAQRAATAEAERDHWIAEHNAVAKRFAEEDAAMSDVVTWLRERGENAYLDDMVLDAQEYYDAATEIERLRAEAERAGRMVAAKLVDVTAELAAERAKRCGTCRWWTGTHPEYRRCGSQKSECGESDDATCDLLWSAQHGCPHWEATA